MNHKYQTVRCVEAVAYTVLSFVLAALTIHFFRELMGWNLSEWNQTSLFCVFAGTAALFGSFFCKLYDGIDRILRAVDRKEKNRSRKAVIINFPTF